MQIEGIKGLTDDTNKETENEQLFADEENSKK